MSRTNNVPRDLIFRWISHRLPTLQWPSPLPLLCHRWYGLENTSGWWHQSVFLIALTPQVDDLSQSLPFSLLSHLKLMTSVNPYLSHCSHTSSWWPQSILTFLIALTPQVDDLSQSVPFSLLSHLKLMTSVNSYLSHCSHTSSWWPLRGVISVSCTTGGYPRDSCVHSGRPVVQSASTPPQCQTVALPPGLPKYQGWRCHSETQHSLHHPIHIRISMNISVTL